MVLLLSISIGDSTFSKCEGLKDENIDKKTFGECDYTCTKLPEGFVNPINKDEFIGIKTSSKSI